MAKAVLVIDMPECCVDCCCGYFERYAKELHLACGATGEDANNVVRPDWCPLRELPDEKCGAWTDGMIAAYNKYLSEVLERKE